MAYNKRNKLLTMQRVIEIYLREKKPGISTAFVYRTYIFPVYPISIATLYCYLNTPVNKQLKELDEKNEVKQLKIF
ncbi:MAG: hypothetical protein ACOYN4_00840 [Bacteroidales bacterium]